MKTLVIHPDDRSTDFLCPIYKPVKNKTVFRGGVTKDQLKKYIRDHDRILLLGHGSPDGLFSVGQFNTEDAYIIDESMVESLRGKTNVYIWCFASEFVKKHSLKGFSTGMFISEVGEALCYDFWYLMDDLEHLIDESNFEFSQIVSK
jgi:hypothetical protein